MTDEFVINVPSSLDFKLVRSCQQDCHRDVQWLTGIRLWEWTQSKRIGLPTPRFLASSTTHRTLRKEQSEKSNGAERWRAPQGSEGCRWSVWVAVKHQASESAVLQISVLMTSSIMWVLRFTIACQCATVWSGKSVWVQAFPILNRISCSLSPWCAWRVWKVSYLRYRFILWLEYYWICKLLPQNSSVMLNLSYQRSYNKYNS